MRHAIILLLVLAAGCAAHDVHGERLNCQDNPTDMRCRQRKPKDHSRDVWYCETRGAGVPRCGWITRDQLDDLIRSIPR